VYRFSHQSTKNTGDRFFLTDYKEADEIWKVSAPKKVTSRSVLYSYTATDSFFQDVITSNYFFNVMTAAFPST